MTKCTHHWIIETNFEHTKPRLSATCKLCGDTRTYSKYIDEDGWRIHYKKQMIEKYTNSGQNSSANSDQDEA